MFEVAVTTRTVATGQTPLLTRSQRGGLRGFEHAETTRPVDVCIYTNKHVPGVKRDVRDTKRTTPAQPTFGEVVSGRGVVQGIPS